MVNRQHAPYPSLRVARDTTSFHQTYVTAIQLEAGKSYQNGTYIVKKAIDKKAPVAFLTVSFSPVQKATIHQQKGNHQNIGYFADI